MLAFAVVLVACLLTSETRVAACSCIQSGPPCEATWKADVVFVGQVLDITDLPPAGSLGDPRSWYRRRVSLKVTEAFLGSVRESVVVYTGQGGGDCGYAFAVRSTYLIYAYRRPDGELM